MPKNTEDKTSLAENKKVRTSHRKKTRKYLFQKLYATTFSELNMDEFDNSFFNDVFDFDLDEKYLDEMYTLVLEKEVYLLNVISLLAPKFKLETMSMSYILPIMIGACEMLFFSEEIPAKVSINESVELAKVYGDDSSKKIVNGVMNKLYKQFDEVSGKINESSEVKSFVLFQK